MSFWLSFSMQIAAVAFVFVFSIFVHELGHAVMGRLSGMSVTSFGVGNHRPFLRWRWWGIRVYLCRNLWWGGLTYYLTPTLFGSRTARILTLAGGLTFNMAFALLGAFAWWFFPSLRAVTGFVVVFNLLLFFTASLPYKVKLAGGVLLSDGAQIITQLKGKLPDISTTQGIESAHFLQKLFRDAGDPLGATAQEVVLAYYWIALGDRAGSRERWKELDAKSLEGLGSVKAIYLLLWQALSIEERQFDEAKEALTALREEIASWGEPDPDASWLADMLEVELLLEKGQLTQAEERLASIESLRPDPPKALTRFHALLQAKKRLHPDAPDMPIVERVAPLDPDDTTFFLVYWAAAEKAAAQGAQSDACEQGRIFLTQWSQLLQSLQTPSFRRKMIELHKARIEKVLDWLDPLEDSDLIDRTQRLLAWDGEGQWPLTTAAQTAAAKGARILRLAVLFATVFVLTIALQMLYRPAQRHKLMRWFGQSPRILCQQSRQAWQNDRPKRAKALAEKALKRNKYYAINCYDELFRQWEADKETKPIHRLANAMLSWDLPKQHRALIHLWRLRAFFITKELDKAKEVYKEALKQDALMRSVVHLNWAKWMFRFKRKDEVIKACTNAAKEPRSLAPALNVCGTFLLHFKAYKVLDQLCQKALKKKDASTYVAAPCADGYQAMGQRGKALTLLNKARAKLKKKLKTLGKSKRWRGLRSIYQSRLTLIDKKRKSLQQTPKPTKKAP